MSLVAHTSNDARVLGLINIEKEKEDKVNTNKRGLRQWPRLVCQLRLAVYESPSLPVV